MSIAIVFAAAVLASVSPGTPQAAPEPGTPSLPIRLAVVRAPLQPSDGTEIARPVPPPRSYEPGVQRPSRYRGCGAGRATLGCVFIKVGRGRMP